MSDFIDDYFEGNITGKGRYLIVLNPYLDSLCNSAFKNMGSQMDVFSTLRTQLGWIFPIASAKYIKEN